MNNKDKASIIKAKKNEIIDNGLEEFYGNPTSSEAKHKLQEIYDDHDYFVENDEKKELIDALENTTLPIYIRLAQFLKDISFKVNTDIEKAMVLLSKKDNKKELGRFRLRTVYREFKKIDRRAEKLTKKRRRQLSKFKDVRKFIRSDFDNLRIKLKEAGFDSYRSSASELTDFFNNCEELSFLNKSKLTKNVRKR